MQSSLDGHRLNKKTPRKRSKAANIPQGLLFVLAAAAIVCWSMIKTQTRLFKSSSIDQPDTLVIYVAGYTDPEGSVNIDYFFKHGIKPNDGAHYIIAVEFDDYPEVYPEKFPSDLPSNVEIIRATGRCYNFGTIGLVLKDKETDLSPYKYFIWMDSSVKGPFKPLYLDNDNTPWHRRFTSQLDAKTKLVGSTISCGGVQVDANSPKVSMPHVHGYLQATDKTGLAILRKETEGVNVFGCHQSYLHAVRFSELGASEAIFKAGYNIGSMMLKYKGVDFRDKDSWECNKGFNPLYVHAYDGTEVNPLEVMFVKSQHWMMISEHPATKLAAKYAQWSNYDPKGNATYVNSNAFTHMAEQYVKTTIEKRGIDCFDVESYIAVAPEELGKLSRAEAWQHFLTFGFREGRPYKFIC
jgi:hypothetical protein